MNSFAGIDPREFLSFYIGKESNGQPARTSTGNSNPSKDPEVTILQAAEQVVSPEIVGDTCNPYPYSKRQHSSLY